MSDDVDRFDQRTHDLKLATMLARYILAAIAVVMSAFATQCQLADVRIAEAEDNARQWERVARDTSAQCEADPR